MSGARTTRAPGNRRRATVHLWPPGCRTRPGGVGADVDYGRASRLELCKLTAAWPGPGHGGGAEGLTSAPRPLSRVHAERPEDLRNIPATKPPALERRQLGSLLR